VELLVEGEGKADGSADVQPHSPESRNSCECFSRS